MFRLKEFIPKTGWLLWPDDVRFIAAVVDPKVWVPVALPGAWVHICMQIGFPESDIGPGVDIFVVDEHHEISLGISHSHTSRKVGVSEMTSLLGI